MLSLHYDKPSACASASGRGPSRRPASCGARGARRPGRPLRRPARSRSSMRVLADATARLSTSASPVVSTAGAVERPFPSSPTAAPAPAPAPPLLPLPPGLPGLPASASLRGAGARGAEVWGAARGRGRGGAGGPCLGAEWCGAADACAHARPHQYSSARHPQAPSPQIRGLYLCFEMC
jgi:hypothetical protein